MSTLEIGVGLIIGALMILSLLTGCVLVAILWRRQARKAGR